MIEEQTASLLETVKAWSNVGSSGALVLIFVGLVKYAPKWVDKIFDRYDASVKRYDDLIVAQNERHAKLLETFRAEQKLERDARDALFERLLVRIETIHRDHATRNDSAHAVMQAGIGSIQERSAEIENGIQAVSVKIDSIDDKTGV